MTAERPESIAPPCQAIANSLDSAKRLDASTLPNPPSPGKNPPSTIPNVQHLVRHYGITVRYNVIKKKLVVTMPGHSGSPDNFDSVALTQIESLATLNKMTTGPIANILALIGDRNLVNPVTDWITSRPWDGRDRLPDLYATLTEREDFPRELKETLIYRWLLSCVAAAFKDSGFSCRGVLTLQGAQGLGKTKWTSALVSDPVLRAQVVKLGHHLDAGDKDSQTAAITHWLVEIGELDGSLKRDIARLKGFLTLEQDKIRRPYGRVESEYARKTVFCATVNDENFLVDLTGNSRFWTLRLAGIDYQHTVDMQQLWAQVLVRYEQGEKWWLEPDEERALEEQNKMHRTESVIRERLLAVIDLDRVGSPNLKAMTSLEVLKRAGVDNPSPVQMKESCAVLRELIGQSKRIRGNVKWRVPLIDLSSLSSDDDEPLAATPLSLEDDVPF